LAALSFGGLVSTRLRARELPWLRFKPFLVLIAFEATDRKSSWLVWLRPFGGCWFFEYNIAFSLIEAAAT
jgi:hypothetical protein